MPDLTTSLHLDMLRSFKRRSRLRRVLRAVTREVRWGHLYGLDWGDPDIAPPLEFIRDRFVKPYVNLEHCAVEIGPGGGRWTRYLVGFRTLYVVDYHRELLGELRRNVRNPSVRVVGNNGTDFPGIPPNSIDYLFSFGCFVHLDIPLIEAYLANMRSILKPGANVVIHYSDKTKIMARLNDGFADCTPEQMRSMVRAAGYRVLEQDVTTMWHSSVIRFTPAQ